MMSRSCQRSFRGPSCCSSSSTACSQRWQADVLYSSQEQPPSVSGRGDLAILASFFLLPLVISGQPAVQGAATDAQQGRGAPLVAPSLLQHMAHITALELFQGGQQRSGQQFLGHLGGSGGVRRGAQALGRCSTSTQPSAVKVAAYSMALSSSRTLPGKG